jgi:plastocyanin
MIVNYLRRCLFLLAAVAVALFALTVGESAQTARADGYGYDGYGYTVGMYDNYFWPRAITIPTGGTVTWVNYGHHLHTTTSVRGRWDSGIMGHGDTFSVRFLRPGSYYYYCRIHPDTMRGVIYVRDRGFIQPANFTVTVSVTIMPDGRSLYGPLFGAYGTMPGYWSVYPY